MERNLKNLYKVDLILLSLIILISLSKEIFQKNIRNLLFSSEITITIKGSGDQYILNNDSLYIDYKYFNFTHIPDQILVNGDLQDYTGYIVYNLDKEENNITLIFNEPLTDCNAMFYNLNNITKIDLSKFDSSMVTEMACMFYDCISLISINFNNFNTSSANDIHRMFSGCSKLTSISLSSFDTSQVTTMVGLFSNCESLLSLDLNNFITSKVEDMTTMFMGCSSIKSLDLNNFDTSSVIRLHGIFKLCPSLLSLKIDNFVTKSCNNFNQMFNGCNSLISLKINHFNTSLTNYIYNMFDDFNNNSIVCINETQTLIIDRLKDLNPNFNNDCTNICFTQANVKIIKEKNICISECSNDDRYKYEFESICYEICPNNTHISSDNEYLCEIDILEDNNFFSTEQNALENFLITDSNIIEQNLITNKNTIESDTDKISESDKISNKNLISSDKNSNEISLESDQIKNILDWNSKDFFNGLYELDNINLIEKDKIIENIKNDIIEGILDLSNLISGDKKDLILKENTTFYQITTTDNQNNEKYEDISSIQLGECEKILKKEYKIDENLPLIIFKIDHFVPGILIPVIGYDIFDPINKTKLNLTYCKNEIVDFQIPVSLNEDDLFKYDPNSEYYTDECFSYTTDEGTDIILNDRHEEYNNNNYSLCENNCSFIEYNTTSKKAICECNIKPKQVVISKIIDDENILSTYNFTNQSSFSNVKTMKCVYNVFSKEGLVKNSGNYILLIIAIAFIILAILFYKFGYDLILIQISDIIKREEKKTENVSNDINIYKKHSKKSKKNNDKKKKGKEEKHKKESNKEIKKRKSEKLKTIKKERKSKKLSMVDIKNTSNSKMKSLSIMEINSNKNMNINKENKIKNKKNVNIEKFYDYEINIFSYDKALKYDKRSFFQFYKSLIKTKHPIILSFVPVNDYNPILVKASLFLMFFSFIYITNALFFSESTIHKIYKEEGNYNISYFMPKIIISFLISHTVYVIIKYFFLTERNLVEIKNFFKNDKKINKTKRIIFLKYLFYFSIGSTILMAFWYYLSSFCAIYKNSQIHLIYNTIICLIISFIYPFIINLLPTILRIVSLKKRNKKLMYKISKALQLI